MPRQFNEPRTKRPILNTAASLTFRPCHFERRRLPRRSYGEGGRNLLFFNRGLRGLRGFSETDQQRLLAFKQGPIIGKTKSRQALEHGG